MKYRQPLIHSLLALASLVTAGLAADVAAPKPAAPPAPAEPKANVQIEIQGGGQIQLNGGAQFQLQLNGARIQAGAAAVAGARQTPAQPPVIFFPGIPSILLPNPLAFGDAKPGFLGLTLNTVDAPADDADAKEKKGKGVGVLNVMEDSPAAKAGLKEGDRVLSFEGKEAKDFTQLREMIRAARPDQAVKLTVRRDGKDIEIKAKLGAAPDAPAIVQFAAGNVPDAVPGVVVFDWVANFGLRSSTSASGGSAQGAAGDKDVVSLRDGNRFLGKIQGLDPVKGLILKREGVPDVELVEDEIRSLTFAEREKAATAGTKVHLQLRDGSWFSGDALTMAEGKILLTLPGGQRLEIPREHAQSATLSDGQAPQIYDGPTGLAGWSTGRTGSGFWEYKDGFLRCLSNGPIGRNFERMPDPLDLSFDVVYPPRLQQFGVTLFSTGMNQSNVGTLTVYFSPQQISGNHYDGRRYNQYNVPLPLEARQFLGQKPEAVRYRLLVDRVVGRVLIYANGIKRDEWKLSRIKPEDIGKAGGFFSFSPSFFMPDSTMQFGRIRVLPWDGKEPANGAGPAEPAGDQVLAGDAAAMDGSIERITDAAIVFAGKGGTARRDKTLFVRFAAPATAKELPAPVALLRLKNGSEFAATQLKGDGQALSVTTRFGSQITVPLSTLRDLDYSSRPGRPESSAKGLDVLTLTDGTQMKGRVVTPIGGEIFRWKIAASKVPIEFPGSRVAGVFFSPVKGTPESPAKGSPESAVLAGSGAVRLGNGDWLPGDVVSLEGNRLVLKTGLAPELVLPLAAVHSLYLGADVTASLADGATGRDLWNDGWNPTRANYPRQQVDAMSKGEPAWAYHDGGYTLTGASRNQAMLAHKWPAYSGAYALNLEIANTGRSPSINVQLFNARDERTFTIYSIGGRVNVYFNPSTARLNRFVGAGKRFQVEEKIDATGANIRVTIVMDRPAKTFRVFMAGKEVGKIPFKEEESAEALEVGGISLSPMSTGIGGKPNRIARLWFAPWDGLPLVTPAPAKNAEPAGEGAEPKKDTGPLPVIHLANGDEFAGTLGKIGDGLVTVESDAGPLELPGKRVAWIHFPGTAEAITAHFPRLRFHDRGLLSVKDLRIEDDRVKCTTLQGQPLDFPRNVVKEIVYRPLE